MRKDAGKEFSKGWKVAPTGEHVFIENDMEVADYKDAYIFNHETCFLKSYKAEEGFMCQAGIYRNDALVEEMSLLEQVLKA